MTVAAATIEPFRPEAPAIHVEQGLLQLPLLELHHGGSLADVTIAWRLAGAPRAPVIAALGGISANRLVFDSDVPERGWWRELVGPGLPLDTTRFRVLGLDWLGGSGETTGPRPGQTDFPRIDARDQAAVLLAVGDALGIGRLHACAGASYGGMVGLALAERAPARVGHVLAISAAHRSNPLATGWRAVQRAIVRHALELGDGPGGLRIARALAMTTYRTRAEFNARFPAGALADGGRAEFPVERYLFARGDEFAARHRPEAFLCLSESIDLHAVDPRRIRTPVTLAAVVEDQLVTADDVRELAARLPAPCRLLELHSRYGHDAFLKERTALAPAFAAALGTAPT
ncbi:MAG: homoserine O-succinyltransferase [Gammaproteobacteria bacterium]|nr:homoserine O-succinyltransferase [Gammaproteobacteria bacterium]